MRPQINVSTSDYDREKRVERLGALNMKMVTLSVGGHTDDDAAVDRMRMVEALNTIKSATRDGFVAGSGSALLAARARALSMADDERDPAGISRMRVVANALTYPARVLARNAGENEGEIVNDVEKLFLRA